MKTAIFASYIARNLFLNIDENSNIENNANAGEYIENRLISKTILKILTKTAILKIPLKTDATKTARIMRARINN